MEKVSEKEKMYRRAIAYVERLTGEGMKITKARVAASMKYGMADTTIRRLTKHLNVRR